ncbi:NADP-dependent oxidoreductase domain-containing protein [Podospora aff. communis PSN243]|uniref:NADP-dependent oxidoreductase domain-containing protein n=1 Tax=Podospora aff. communis PSN243 TaxID=3040156 RepID=A0AAV9GE90_9PEZI|nr:NADP-dependent oxidoreductase domain-containing protein [Podospora aff. communis PSN243]
MSSPPTGSRRRKIGTRSCDACKIRKGVTVKSLVLRLCIYRLRLFPVWPIVAVEEVIAALQRDTHDVETRLLAVAVGAATMAQLKLDRFQDTGVNDDATAASLEEDVRTAFFLHIYHENQQHGGTKSLLYLREAITLGQIMGLHRPSAYLALSTAEDRLRRRLLWLLFVTERGVAMLHKLPVVWQRAERLPPLESSAAEEEVLQEAADNVGGIATGASSTVNREMFNLLQRRLQESPIDSASGGNDVQKADIFVTRQWMQVLLWRAALCNWIASAATSPTAVAGPIQIAQEFLDLICQLPHSALESHGPAIEFKVYEIASAKILATSRGGNSKLLQLLALRTSQTLSPSYGFPLDPSAQETRVVEEVVEDRSRSWGLDAASDNTERSFQDDPPELVLPPSPWMSLVAAAEIEQGTGPYSTHSGNHTGEQLSASSLETNWDHEPPQPNTTVGEYGTNMTGTTSSAGGLSSGRAFGELLNTPNWFLGLDPRCEPRKTGMMYRRLGNSGLHVSALGLGGWLTFGGQVENDTTIACLKQAYDCGINFFDTAESYAGGQSEIVMGKAIKTLGWKRNDIVISTKLNWGGANGEVLVNNHGLSRKHIIEGLRASLQRLDLEYVDIVYAHRPDRLTPMEEVVRAFNHVIEIKGWAMYWGTSEWSADEIAEACGIAKQLGLIAPVVEQPFYNLLHRKKVEGEFQRLYSRFGLGLTTFSPLKFGLLSGKYSDSPDAPPAGSRFAKGSDKFVNYMRDNYGNKAWQEDIEKVKKIKVVADKVGIPQSELALAWCLMNPNVSCVITGASKPEQIIENVKALQSLDKLTPDIMDEIDEAVGSVELDPARQDY